MPRQLRLTMIFPALASFTPHAALHCERPRRSSSTTAVTSRIERRCTTLPLTAHIFFPTTHGRSSRVHAATIFTATFVTSRTCRPSRIRSSISRASGLQRLRIFLRVFFPFYASFLRVSVTCRALIRVSAHVIHACAAPIDSSGFRRCVGCALARKMTAVTACLGPTDEQSGQRSAHEKRPSRDVRDGRHGVLDARVVCVAHRVTRTRSRLRRIRRCGRAKDPDLRCGEPLRRNPW